MGLKPDGLAELIALITDGTISGKIGKDILPELMERGAYTKLRSTAVVHFTSR